MELLPPMQMWSMFLLQVMLQPVEEHLPVCLSVAHLHYLYQE
jgi:hypothetical protein